MEERLVSGTGSDNDAPLEISLRPRRLEDFTGQERIKEHLRIAIIATQRRKEPLDHLLLYGPPGLGKTTLANIIASEMGVNIRITSGPAVERAGDLAAILTSLQPEDVLFIDEIHRLGRIVEEVLYPALEDFALDLVLGKGPAARSLRLSLPKFTLIGATTRYSMVSPPLRDRFGTVHRLDFYDKPAMETIIRRSTQIMGVPTEDAGIKEIARRARGTPRIANRLLRRVRDYAQVMAQGIITFDVATEALGKMEIDELGLDQVDRSVLHSIVEKFNGGPVGLETLAASISEESDTIMDVYEPYLLQLGFLQRTPRGRVATKLGYEHLGLTPPKSPGNNQATLWDVEQPT
jgi:Holliday junction DNA helicase RuvB